MLESMSKEVMNEVVKEPVKERTGKGGVERRR